MTPLQLAQEKLDRIAPRPGTAEQRAQAVEWLLGFVALCPTAVARDEFLRRISTRMEVDLQALRDDLSVRMGGSREAPPPVPRAPLEPNAFLRWMIPDRRVAAHTVEDLAFEFDMTVSEMHRVYVRLASRVRRNQRLGLDPWEGIQR